MSVCSLPNLTLPLLLAAPLSLSPSLSYTVYRNATTQATLSVFRSRGSREGEKESIKTQSQSQSASSCAFSFMSDVKYSQGGVGAEGKGSTSQRYSVCWVLELALTFVVSLLLLVFIHFTHREIHFGVLWSYAMSHHQRRTHSPPPLRPLCHAT